MSYAGHWSERLSGHISLHMCTLCFFFTICSISVETQVPAIFSASRQQLYIATLHSNSTQQIYTGLHRAAYPAAKHICHTYLLHADTLKHSKFNHLSDLLMRTLECLAWDWIQDCLELSILTSGLMSTSMPHRHIIAARS